MMDIIIAKLAVTSISIGLLSNFLLGGSAEVQPTAQQSEKITQTIKIETPTEKWLNYVLPKLKKQESGNNRFAINWEDAKYTGEPSIGCFQFQPQTFISYTKLYKLLPYAEDKEIMNFINDCEYQEKLTRLILINEKNGWLHWKTSFNKLKLPKSYD